MKYDVNECMIDLLLFLIDINVIHLITLKIMNTLVTLFESAVGNGFCATRVQRL